jgi:hypothetical protein
MEKISEASFEELALFLNNTFKTQIYSQSYLDWLYIRNPEGRVIGFNEYYSGKIVGHYALVPWSLEISGQKINAALSLNTAVGKIHQGHGLFTNMAENTYKLAYENGIDIIYGVANQNSTHGFINKLNFTIVDHIDAYFGVSIKLNNSQSFTNWSPEFMKWRVESPRNRWLLNKSVLKSENRYFGLKPIYFNNFRNSTDISHAYGLNFLLSNMRPTGIMFKIPKAFKPSPLNIIFKNLSHRFKDSEYLLYFKKTNMGSLDFDAF